MTTSSEVQDAGRGKVFAMLDDHHHGAYRHVATTMLVAQLDGD